MAVEDDEVHVWQVPLDAISGRVQSLKATLSSNELRRAEAFHFQQDRVQFIVARGMLRAILSRYLDTDPSDVCFRYTRHGKPELDGPPALPRLTFNVSRTAGLALYAVAGERAVGVDLERVRADFPWAHIADQFFSVREKAALHAVIADRRDEAFFACWTRKEAYVKARGAGLSLPLDRFDVSFGPYEQARLECDRGDSQAILQWALQELSPGPGYMGAIAAEGCDWHVTHVRC